MRHHSPIISVVGCAAVHDLDTVPVEVKYCSIESAIVASSACWRSIGSPSGIQSGGVEVSNGCAACSGERDVCCASLDSGLLSVAVYLNMDRQAYPGVSWLKKKSASRIPKPT